ncbi:hypothetical protein R1flu_011679 [Riccia fluitans]|uniref:Uncharacterized protein n=1 Tax=Riccia fluitans TaxID=41844 RepID=A0ABD1ZBS9_9MARC
MFLGTGLRGSTGSLLSRSAKVPYRMAAMPIRRWAFVDGARPRGAVGPLDQPSMQRIGCDPHRSRDTNARSSSNRSSPSGSSTRAKNEEGR